ncbi:hypothetical protein BX600DRAFT_544961 [Xylariales sp. PMI_506]|nr:hypothetical protein BX600DRAFT_544961 [Xylariales sp. PMI_506]
MDTLGQPIETMQKKPRKRFHKKERTGCITCKNRHLKCDERKPSCYRCLKAGYECDGYNDTIRQFKPPPLAHALTASGRVQIPKAQLTVQPSEKLFETEEEQRYFTLFNERVVEEMLPYFDNTVWKCTILQASASEPSILHAAVAIGALGKTFEAAQAGRGRPPTARQYRAPTLGGPVETAQRVKCRVSRKEQLHGAFLHHQYSLEQYHKAIKGMHGIAAGGKIRTLLITSLIILCFEVLHGNQEAAAFQLQYGNALIQEWKKNERDASKHPMGFSSPAPDAIEDYLVQFFGRLEIQAMSFRDTRPPECHATLKEEGKEVVQQMPKLFASINEARVYLDLIMRRMMHFTAHINHFKVSFAQYEDAPAAHIPEPWIDSKVPKEAKPLPKSDPPYYSEQEQLVAEMGRWMVAFTPLFSRCVENGGRQRVSALTLCLAATTAKISIQTAFIKAETEYDVFEPEFRRIVLQSVLLLQTLEEEYTPRKKLTLAFSFDLGVIPPLFLTAVKCRNSEIRHEALRLMNRYPRREGVWDSVTAAALGTWVAGLEEEDVGAGVFVPEDHRVRKPSIKVNLVKRTATMTCFKLSKQTNELTQRIKNITW